MMSPTNQMAAYNCDDNNIGDADDNNIYHKIKNKKTTTTKICLKRHHKS